MPGLELETSAGDGLRERRPREENGHFGDSMETKVVAKKREKTFGRTPDGAGM